MKSLNYLEYANRQPKQNSTIFTALDSNELIKDNLKFTLKHHNKCEITWNFIEEVKNLSNQYYKHFNNPSYSNILHTVVDIQSILELSDKFINDFEEKYGNFHNVIFTLHSLGNEIEKVELSVETLLHEVEEFWKVIQNVDRQNMNAVRILHEIWKLIDELKDSKYILSSKVRNFIKGDLYKPKNDLTNMFLSSPNSYMNDFVKNLKHENIYFNETLRQIQILNILLMNNKLIVEYQPMFSFYLILLLNERELSVKNGELKKPEKSTKCFPNFFKKKNARVNQPSAMTKMLNDPNHVFKYLEKQLMVIGDKIFEFLKDIKEFQCAALRREEILLQTIQANHMVFIKCLNKMQSLTVEFERLDDHNDTLIGKLTKTRPNFKTIMNHINFDANELMDMLKANVQSSINE